VYPDSSDYETFVALGLGASKNERSFSHNRYGDKNSGTDERYSERARDGASRRHGEGDALPVIERLLAEAY
jgi:hypothetical protein